MADVLGENVQFQHENGAVPNPTYGMHWKGSNRQLSEEDIIDYQCVSDVNPNYSTVESMKESKSPSDSPPMIEKGGIPIPRSLETQNGINGHSASNSNTGFSPESPRYYNFKENSLSQSLQSYSSQGPLLPGNSSSGNMCRQTSQTSELSSSPGSEAGVDKCPNPIPISSAYSYARHPSAAIRSRHHSDQHSLNSGMVVLTHHANRIDEEVEEEPFNVKGSNVRSGSGGAPLHLTSRGDPHSRTIPYTKDSSRFGFSDTQTLVELIIGVFAFLTIILSIVVIIWVVVLVVRIGNKDSTTSGGTTTVDPSTLLGGGNQSTSGSCTICEDLEEQTNKTLNELRSKLLGLSQNNYLSLAAGSRLSGLFSKVSSIGESVEDIRVSYNSTAANRTSNLNLLAGVTVNVSDDCIVIEKSPCQIPNFGIYQCRTPNFDFIDQQGRIVVNFNCYVKPTKTDIANFRGHTQTAIDINTPSNPTPDQVFEALQTAELSCFCTTFDKTQGSCNYFVKRCPYTRTSHVTFHT